jgi:hypothetical protein
MKGTASAVLFLVQENRGFVIPSAGVSREESASRLRRAGLELRNEGSDSTRFKLGVALGSLARERPIGPRVFQETCFAWITVHTVASSHIA